MISVGDSLKAVQKLVGRTVRAKPGVNSEGTIYNRKKKGIVHRIEIDNFFGISVWITFEWKVSKGYRQVCMRFPFKEVEWEILEIEDSLGIII